MCGIPADERALDVDHIIPRKAGGAEALENFQALCWRCNTNKGAGDDADFRNTGTLYAQKQSGCVFCEIAPERVIAENSLAFAITDGFPVAPLHTLIISRRHVAEYFDLFTSEERALRQLLRQMESAILQQDKTVSAFNVGINAGASAGQTISHCHVHLIPRREGDTPNPRGGVRAVIPGKAIY